MSNRENVSDRFISSAMHSDGIDNTLSRMLGDNRTVGSLHPKFCGECGEPCKVAYPHPSDPDMVYCRQHFESLVGPICEGCNRGVVGNFTSVNGKKYHPQCSNEDHSCARCSKPVIGQSVVALNKRWHNACFTCTLCGLALGDSYIERGGSPYCKSCNVQLQKSPNAGLATSSSANAAANKEIMERNKIKTDLYDNVQKGKEACNWCRQIINNPIQVVKFNGAIYHETCFTCNKCEKEIGNQPFVNKDGVQYCQDCGKSKPIECFGCKKPLTSTYTVAVGNKYHPQCLVCNKCRKSLEGGYVQGDAGQVFCVPCGKTQSSASSTTSTYLPAGRTKGFTIDPRSGKKTFH